jgi:hypothetical protein
MKRSNDMSRRQRRNHGSEFKAKVALEAIKGEQTLAQDAELRSAQAVYPIPNGYNEIQVVKL